ncbi:MAG: hypothetical protein IJT81_04310 [Lachnospiraceae bacterium]|nr:hypothetical protein [Lachnospiraceae bacterium]
MSYAICLETDEQDSGYVVVSARQDHMPIMEYAFSGKPVFEEKMKENELAAFRSYNEGVKTRYDLLKNHIVMNSIFEYYLMRDGRFFDLLNRIIDINKIMNYIFKGSASAISENLRLKKLLEENSVTYRDYPGQEDGYVINNRIVYLTSRYGSYTCLASKVLPNFTGFLTGDFHGANNCSLVAIATVAKWLRLQRSQYSNIPFSIKDIYEDVYTIALNNGYKDDADNGGTDYGKIPSIAERAFKKWGYNISAYNRIVSLFNVCRQHLDDLNNPLLLSTRFGGYENHTVTVMGYYEYDVASFLAVKDGWVTATRYIHYEELTMIKGLTTINA